jgi:hypothetical protein
VAFAQGSNAGFVVISIAGQHEVTPPLHSLFVRGLQFDDTIIATSSNDHSIRVHSREGYHRLGEYQFTDSVVTLHYDDSRLVCGASNGTVCCNLWKYAT